MTAASRDPEASNALTLDVRLTGRHVTDGRDG